MIKFFKWLFRVKPKAVPVESVITEEAHKPTPGEHTLDIALGHISRIKATPPGYVEKPRVTGMPPAMAAPYHGVTPSEMEMNRARGRLELQHGARRVAEQERSRQAARNHQFATQYTQPATPQDRTVEDLVLMAAIMAPTIIETCRDDSPRYEPSTPSDNSGCDSSWSD